MDNFLKLEVNSPIEILTQELDDALKAGLVAFDKSIRIQYEGSPHREAEDIFLRFNQQTGDVFNDLIAFNYDAWYHLPSFSAFVLELAHYVGATQIGRVMLTKLEEGKRIYPHADRGAPAEFYQRYQIPISGSALFRIGKETLVLQPGEIWWINNSEEHEVVNDGFGERITLIVDLREED